MTGGAPARAGITIVLLAGGAATRLPGKLALPIDGEPMLVRVYRRLTATGLPCILSVRSPGDDVPHALAGVPLVADRYPDAGPLGGLVSCASAVRTPLLFAAAGDAPNLDARFIEDLASIYDDAAASGAAAADAVVPRWPNGMWEPLAALYAVEPLLRAGAKALADGRRKVTAILDGMRVLAFALRPQDEARLANVNTPADYAANDLR